MLLVSLVGFCIYTTKYFRAIHMTQSPYIMAYDMNVSACDGQMLKSCVYEMKYGFIFLFTGV